ncbi:MAG: penicillin-binding protein 2 [Fimbriimonadales bacterium]|nr:penicillin-binding protein 2 [Fimbriimonadales bacterium]MDW8052376.1 penicillin-binding protein 2 [Armatimonadota bacterium]
MARPHTTVRHATVRLKAEDLRRGQWLGLALAAGGIAIAGRLVQLQVLQHETLRQEGERRRWHRRPLLAKRGAILDRTGKPLAQSDLHCHVAIDPLSVREPERLAQVFATHLGGTPAQWHQRIVEAQKHERRYLRVAQCVPLERYEQLRHALRKAFAHLARPERPVLTREIVPVRAYLQPTLAPQVIGLTQLVEDRETGNRLVAVSGIERSYDALLAGKNGVEEGELAPGGVLIPETVRRRLLPQDGASVRLTLDCAIQQAAEDALETLWRKHRPKGALMLVLEPQSGDLLAVANRPTFNLATRAGLHPPRSDSPAERERALEPMRNRATEFLYEPGSTIKPLVIAALLSEGKLDPSARFYCGGSYRVGRRRIRCVVHGRGRGHGLQTLEEAICHSCNVAMAQIGTRIGLEGIYRALQRFHLFEPMRAGFAYEEVGHTIPPEKVRWGREVRAANLAFGQGLLVSPLALAAAYGALANNGQWVAPRIVLEPAPARQPPQVVVSPEHARYVMEGLIRAVERGTGQAAQVKGYLIAGKTGTAQKALPGGRGYAPGKYVASFVGIVPADAPRAVILVMADEPQHGYHGGEVAAPAFRQLAQFLLWYWRIPATWRHDFIAPRIANRYVG